jgi:hypothetical protein
VAAGCFGIVVATIVARILTIRVSGPALENEPLLEHLIPKLSEGNDNNANNWNCEERQVTLIHNEPLLEGFYSIAAPVSGRMAT